MNTITSTRTEAAPQKDGRLFIREVHTADGGERQERVYLAPANADLDEMLTENGRLFLASLAGV